MKKRSNFSIMLRLISLIKPLVGYMFLAVTMGVMGHLRASFITILGTQALMSYLGLNISLSLKTILILLLVFALLRSVLRYAEQACNHYIAFKLLAIIRNKVFVALRKLSPAKLEGKDKGNLISVITSDIELLEVFYAHTISPILIAIIFSSIMCLFIGQYNGTLAIVAVIAYLFIGVLIPIITSKTSGNSGNQMREQSGILSGFVLDSLRGLSEIIQYNAGYARLGQLKEKTESLAQTEKIMKKISGTNTAITNCTILVFDMIMLLAGSALCLQGKIPFEVVVVCFVALSSSFGPVTALSALGSTLQNTFGAADRVLNILDEEPIVKDIKDGLDISFSGAEAENVNFAYGDEKIIENIDIEVPKGKVIGLIGRSGSGKSTLLKLFMRFWEPQSGNITISDENISKINTSNLRDIESYMTQQTYLFHDTIANNLRIAKPDASLDEIQRACQKAAVHDFIMSLEKGYNTDIGELGSTLSGGERQRLGLAMAFLHDAPFMILDEPTSNLDSLNEAIILKALHEEKADKTVLLVSHRQSTMRIADKIYNIESGRLS